MTKDDTLLQFTSARFVTIARTGEQIYEVRFKDPVGKTYLVEVLSEERVQDRQDKTYVSEKEWIRIKGEVNRQFSILENKLRELVEKHSKKE